MESNEILPLSNEILPILKFLSKNQEDILENRRCGKKKFLNHWITAVSIGQLWITQKLATLSIVSKRPVTLNCGFVPIFFVFK